MSHYDTNSCYKIDNYAVNGLSGVSDSLAYKVAEIETHVHSRERWFGKAATPSGETHAADPIGAGIAPFVLDAGNNAWGEWTLLLGSEDTPSITGSMYFDPHQGVITAVEHVNTIYLLQFGGGPLSANIITSGAYTETMAQLTATAPRGLPINIQTRRIESGTKAWGRCLAMGQNTGTISFYIGIHEYEG